MYRRWEEETQAAYSWSWISHNINSQLLRELNECTFRPPDIKSLVSLTLFSSSFIVLCSPTTHRTLCMVSGLFLCSPLLGSRCVAHTWPGGGKAQGSVRHTGTAGECQRWVLSDCERSLQLTSSIFPETQWGQELPAPRLEVSGLPGSCSHCVPRFS